MLRDAYMLQQAVNVGVLANCMGDEKLQQCNEMGLSKQLRGRAAIGNVTIWKQFHDANALTVSWYQGTVIGYNAHKKWYLVRYLDGDTEEFSWVELQHWCKEPPAGEPRHIPADAEDQRGPRKRQKTQQQQQQQWQCKQPQAKLQAPNRVQKKGSPDVCPAAEQDQRSQAAASAVQGNLQLSGSPEPSVSEQQQAPADGAVEQQHAGEVAAGRVSRSGSIAPEATAAAAASNRQRQLAHKSCTGQVPKPARRAVGAADKAQQQQQQQHTADAVLRKTTQTAAGAGNKKRSRQRKTPTEAKTTVAAAEADASAATGEQMQLKKRQYKRKSSTAPAAAAGEEGCVAAAAGGGAGAAGAGSAVQLEHVEQLVAEAIIFQPARDLQIAYLQAAKAFLDVQGLQDAEQAAEVAMTADGSKPLWLEEEQDVKVYKGDVMKGLKDRAVTYEPGKEPWRRFAGPPSQVSTKRDAEGSLTVTNTARAGSTSGAAAAAAASAQAVTAVQGKKADKAAAAEAARIVNALLQGKVFFVADQPFADPGAELANAIKITKDEFWKEYRLATVTEAERVAGRKAAQAEATGQSKEGAASAAAGDEPAARGEQEEQPGGSKAKGSTDKALLEKNPSARPDRVAESKVLNSGRAVNRFGKQRCSWGHLPGITINSKYMLRSEAHVLGAHKSPMTGIVTADIPVPIVIGSTVYRAVKAATSIVMSGCYQDDHDTMSDIVKYTGEGGNDLLGNKKQVEDQKLARGNRALLGNISLGLPVRVFRRNDDCASATNSVLFFDGLYDVVSYVKTVGEAGKIVYIFGLKRRPGQEDSLSKPIERFKGVGTAKRGVDVRLREHVVCKDLSKGKERLPVVVVNEVDRELPPGLSLPEDSKWVVDDKTSTDGPFIPNREKFRYATADEYAADVQPPQPPRVLDEDSAEAAEAMAAELNAAAAAEAAADDDDIGDDMAADAVTAGVAEQEAQPEQQQQQQGGSGCTGGCRRRLRSRGNGAAAVTADAVAAGAVKVNPSGTGGRPNGCLCWYTKELVVRKAGEGPHDLLKRLNWGYLPYESLKSSSKDGSKLAVSRGCCPVLTECGPWTGCTDPDCDQRQGTRGVQYRFEVFKTRDGRGWGLRSWDTIKCGSLVAIKWGKVIRTEHIGSEEHAESSYLFDKQPRRWATIVDSAHQQLSDKEKLLLKDEQDWSPRFVVCSKQQGAVARFINHSCDPSLYVQPMCMGHTNTEMVSIGLFAAKTIPPFTELSYDYGCHYIEHNLDGVCLCSAECCRYKPQQQQGAAEMEQD